MENQIILIGCGQIGHDALVFLGSENVACFCDNNPLLAGTEKYGKPVISFANLKAGHGGSIVVIAVAGHTAYDIAQQCEENGVPDYLIYTDLREAFPAYDREKLLCFISDPLNRMQARKDIYYKRTAELKAQVGYFKRHTDIRHMKPAEGALRSRQKQCVRASIAFFQKIEETGVRPILYGGNLLGYVRHQGFIPWDDDIDFLLVRQEYERLKEYCRQHICTEDEWERQAADIGKVIPPGMECYYWYLWHDHFCVVEVRDDGCRTGMDFFSLEYYEDSYTLGELRTLAMQVRAEVVCMDSEEEKIRYMEETLEKNREHTAQESGNIYFGLDNMEIQNVWQREHFMPAAVVFPLKQVMWEGEIFWVPNDPEEFLTYEYEDYWEFPEDVGIPSHQSLRGLEMKAEMCFGKINHSMRP